jgi:hypothetical protein
MSKSRSFSIYLLKEEGFDATNALRQDHTLDAAVTATGLPDASTLFVLDGEPRPPWWRSYFGIEQPLSQMNKGALIFLPVGTRCFALSFGHDTLEPGAAKRQRTQLPIESELTFFDFDRDSTVLRSLTGKVKDEFKDLFKHATGASNLRISSDIQANGLAALCEQLLVLYQADDYRAAFPEI